MPSKLPSDLKIKVHFYHRCLHEPHRLWTVHINPDCTVNALVSLFLSRYRNCDVMGRAFQLNKTSWTELTDFTKKVDPKSDYYIFPNHTQTVEVQIGKDKCIHFDQTFPCTSKEIWDQVRSFKLYDAYKMVYDINATHCQVLNFLHPEVYPIPTMFPWSKLTLLQLSIDSSTDSSTESSNDDIVHPKKRKKLMSAKQKKARVKRALKKLECDMKD